MSGLVAPGVYYHLHQGMTMKIIPSEPERECWYINMGAVNREFFDTQSMVKSAP